MAGYQAFILYGWVSNLHFVWLGIKYLIFICLSNLYLDWPDCWNLVRLSIILYDWVSFVWLSINCMAEYHFVWLSIILYGWVSFCIAEYHFVWLSIILYGLVSFCIVGYQFVCLSIILYGWVSFCRAGYHFEKKYVRFQQVHIQKYVDR